MPADTQIAEVATGGDRNFQAQFDSTRSAALANVDLFGALRNRSRLLVDDIAEGHSRAVRALIAREQTRLQKKTVPGLLEDLSNSGFSWRQIARMAGVSVPAVQKWRSGERASAERHGRLAAVTSVVTLLANDWMVNDVASWCSMRIAPEVGVTPVDLIADERYALVYALAAEHLEPEAVLDEYQPQWRSTAVDDGFEVFEAEDGQLAIRPRA